MSAPPPSPPSSPPTSEQYRLAPALAARLLGLSLAGVGVLVLLATAVIALAGLPLVAVTPVIVAAIVAIFVLGVLVTRRIVVLELRDAGYRVRFVRGAGVSSARWSEVERLDTAEVAGDRCLVIRLRAGGTTTIPVAAVQADPDDLVRAVRARLQRSSKPR